jgi:hypothetical protein
MYVLRYLSKIIGSYITRFRDREGEERSGGGAQEIQFSFGN